MSGRPTRRATRRTAVDDSDDDVSSSANTSRQTEDADDSIPDAPQRRSTRATRRTPAASAPAPAPRTTTATRGRGRPKKTPTPAPVEPEPVAEPEQEPEQEQEQEPEQEIEAEPEPVSTVELSHVSQQTFDDTMVKHEVDMDVDELSQIPSPATQRKSRSARPSTATVVGDPVETPPTPTPPTPAPKASASSPTVVKPPQTPLANATSTLNIRKMGQTTIKPPRTIQGPAFIDKPIDIVLKSRTMVIPSLEDTTPKSRIVITHLYLTNFKSYAGRQEIGPFHASFSSVVGPNGSGKSNVIDSLLFVFGFRASKMRQGKISALIHNSAKFPDLDHCEVSVHFQEVMDQPGGGHTVIPDSQLIISRKAFKNNSSKYYINGKESNFTTVTTLLRDRGVDLDHKRFLILQGEVESIAQMRPKAANEHDDGLLEYLEDIIGTSKYKTPIEESATEVEELNEVCAEKNGRVQHVEKEKNSLEDKKNKAVAYMRDENELAMKQSALYQLFIRECNDNVAVTQEAINQMQAQLDVEQEKHQGSQQLIKDLEKRHSKAGKEFDAQEKQAQSMAKELSKFEQERVKFDEKHKFLEDKKTKLERTIANAENTSEEADQTISDCAEEIKSRAGQIADLEEQLKEEEAELAKIREDLKGKTQAFSDQITSKQKSLEPWTEKINQKQSQITIAESELNILREKANAGAVAMKELEGKISAIEEGKASKQEDFKKYEAEKEELIQEAEKLESELKILSEQEPKMRAKISSARQKADEARSSLASTQSRGNVLSALMRMKESGRIDGFHGRLGNLGVIDPKYDVAVSTACPSLDNFVTETVESGQQCIEHLRKYNVGRGNFLCLDKLRSRDMSPIQTPEDAPRLFDLIQSKDKKFLPAFYQAMQDTLVAADLAQANRIAYGARRWRVVTLAGELIDKSGTLSGGGNIARRGLMSSKLVADTTKEQVTKLEEDRDHWQSRLQELQEYQRECETRLREINDKLPQLDTKMQKLSLELGSSTRNIADLQRRIKEVAKEHQPSADDDSRAAALQKEIAKLTKDIEKLHGETSSIEEEIKALQDKIMEAGGEKLRSQRTKIDFVKEEIAGHHEETSNAEVRKVKAEKQKVKLEKDRTKAVKELNNAAEDLQKLEDDINNQGEKAEELSNRVSEAEEVLAATKKELKALKAELDEKTNELNETRAIEIEMKNKLEENQKALIENQRRLRYWDDKLSKLTMHEIEDLMGAPVGARIKPDSPQKKRKPSPMEEDSEGEGEDGDEGRTEKSSEDEEMVDAPEEAPETEANEDEESDNPPQQLPRYTPDELADMSKETLKGEIAALEEKIQNVNVDLGVLAEYRRRVEEHASRSSDLQTSLNQRDAAKKRCDDLRRLRLEGFMDGLGAISLRLKEMYQLITMGGNAELELVDSLDPFSEGIQFSVMPPKKSWKNISNLSGGEKTLSSLALVFALHHYKPTPLYVMDEIDAALDFRNVSIVANYIKERTKNAQFIVISLRNNMFELASRLIGVYKVNHMTKSVTIDNKDFIERPPGQAQQRPVMGGGGLTTTLALR
ncbi:unnamed protein product [Clonostachys solani]|uniref:Structural maintenance of chromosomes protein n=1 Tax=Clonostachys solani TaxID=160281 RepID=A0A9N9Z8U4_9HYPO|nr:unnamed protein product [Clonostachys solani]